MDVVMSLLSYIKWHIFRLIYEMGFYSILFAIISLVLFWICNKCGWTKINPKGPKWFIVLFALFTVISSASIGGHVGFQVGVSKITAKIVDDSGQLIIEKGIIKAAQSLNLDINQKIDVREAKLLFNKMEKMNLVDSKGWSADILNKIYEMMVVPFVSKAETYTNQLAPNSEIIPAQIVNSTWNNYNSLVKEESKKIKDAAIINGISLALAFIFIPVLIVSVIRVCIAKAKQSIEETPHKIIDGIQPVNNDGGPALLSKNNAATNNSCDSENTKEIGSLTEKNENTEINRISMTDNATNTTSVSPSNEIPAIAIPYLDYIRGCLHHLKGKPKCFMENELNKSKYAKYSKKFLPESEHILCAIDDSFGIGKQGVIFTESGLFYKKFMEDPMFFSYNDIIEVEIKSDYGIMGSNLVFSQGEVTYKAELTEKLSAQLLFDVLLQIKKYQP